MNSVILRLILLSGEPLRSVRLVFEKLFTAAVYRQPTAHQAASCLSASATPSSTLLPPSTCNTRLRISDGGTSCSGVQMALRARRLNGAQSRDIRVAGLPKEGDGAELTPTLVPARPSRFLVLDRRASHRKWCFRFHSLHHRRTPDGPDSSCDSKAYFH